MIVRPGEEKDMRKILVVVDMQNDFIDGALGTQQAREIVQNVVRKIESYTREGASVFATRDTHGEDYLTTSEGRHLPIPHCIRGTKGWEIRPEIAGALDRAGAEIIDKPTFGSQVLARKLTKLAGERPQELEIEVIGLCTDICVVSNALLLKAAMPEALIRVDPACTAGVTPESCQAALLTMKMCQVEVE